MCQPTTVDIVCCVLWLPECVGFGNSVIVCSGYSAYRVCWVYVQDIVYNMAVITMYDHGSRDSEHFYLSTYTLVNSSTVCGCLCDCNVSVIACFFH